MAELGINAGKVSPHWYRDGEMNRVATLRGANGDEGMWAWGADQRVRFWPRRQLDETLVHRIGSGLTARIRPAGTFEVATYAIEKFLENLSDAG